MNDENIIDKFILGALSKSELINFNERLKSDPKFKAEVDVAETLVKGINHKGNVDLKAHLKTLVADVKTPNQTKDSILTESKSNDGILPAKNNSWIWKLLLGVLIIGGLIYMTQLFNSQAKEIPHTNLFAENYERFELNPGTRDEGQADLMIASALYNQNKNDLAIPLFEKLVVDKNQNSEVMIALSNAYIETGKFDKAKALLLPIASNKNDLFKDQATWYIALMCLKNNDIEGSKNRLKVLVEDPSADFHQEAKALLKKLKK